MNPEDVESGLRAIRTSLDRILAGSCLGVIDEAIAQVGPATKLWKSGFRRWQKHAAPWGYRISRERPLEFQACDIRGHRSVVDLACALRWSSDTTPEPIEQNIALRVWSLDKRICFRREFDAEHIENILAGLGKRVMLRLHFDLANSGQQGPKYHIQIGGVEAPSEYCWLHPSVNLPRIAHPPSDIVLICEMIACNFFPDQYRAIRTDPIWQGVVRDIQRSVLQEYFHQCYEAVISKQQHQSLLDRLWNIPWQR